jgi:transketolase
MFNDLEEKALDLRRSIINVCKISGEGHITSSLSCIDILTALYFGGILRYDPKDAKFEGRDRFIAKGHGTLALYSVLSMAGFFPEPELYTFAMKGTRLGGLATTAVPGVEAHTGSLGHGLPFAVGVALSLKIKNSGCLAYVMTGDGECQEGSIWEAAASIIHFNLNNLVWIIDRNGLQVSGFVDDVMGLGDLAGKLRACGFDCVEIDGHDFGQIMPALSGAPSRPRVIIANTVKGKGVPFLENKRGWHGKKPSKTEMAVIMDELGINTEN